MAYETYAQIDSDGSIYGEEKVGDGDRPYGKGTREFM